MFEVLTSQEFDKDYGKLDKSIRVRVDKALEQLEANPFTGKPLGYTFFREKKIGKFRVYYLIYEDRLVVFVIAMSEKKDQQPTINSINKLIPFYREEIEKRFKA